ncbi:MAG: TraX family protein [Proteocatella sp.]
MNAFQIKILMVVLMTLDHLHYLPIVSPDLELIFGMISRCVSVWFAYGVVEGFLYTRSRLKYNGRLFFWAGIVFVGNTILNYMFMNKEINLYANIILTLAIGALLLNIIEFKPKSIEEWSKNKITALKIFKSLLVIVLLFFPTEGGFPILPFIVITYLFRNKIKFRNILYIALSALMFCGSYVPYETVGETLNMMAYNCDWLFITVLPFIYLYNGQRGNNSNVAKYFFYVYYPLHIWIFSAITYFVK